MGIRNLTTFITRIVPNGFFNVNVEQEIEKWKRDHPNQIPVIVIDFPGFVNGIFNDRVDILCGLSNERNMRLTRMILEKFHSLGVKLVFFQDGASQPHKSDTIINRQHTSHQRCLEVIDAVTWGGDLLNTIADQHDVCLPYIATSGIRAVVLEFGCEFIKSTLNECDKEIVDYANRNKAMAIMADDSDFLIFEGIWKYWSLSNFNVFAFETMQYNRFSLWNSLGLKENQMPLLATLSGNDLIPYDMIQGFHQRLGPVKIKFVNMAKIIRQELRSYPGRLTEDFYSTVACRLFRGSNLKLSPDERVELVKRSLNQYNLNDIIKLPVTAGDELLEITSKMYNSYSYEILLNLPVSLTPSYFDVRKPEYSQFIPLALELYRCQVGVVLYHRCDPSITRKIWVMRDTYALEEITPIYPPFPIPQLIELYDILKNDIEMLTVKVRLVAWMISARLDYEMLKKIEKPYFCLVLNLFFLVEHKLITIVEADLFLYTLYKVNTDSTILSLLHPARLDARPFQLSFLYGKFLQWIRHVVSTTGLDMLIEYDRFEGVFFHKEYTNFVSLTDDERMELLKNVLHLRIYSQIPVDLTLTAIESVQ